MKIALGTAQFGLDYGINNERGKIPLNEVIKLLDRCWETGIDVLDTAYAYGNSEKIVGDYIANTGREFKVVSKLPNLNLAELETAFYSSLENLHLDHMYGCLIHDFDAFLESPQIWDFFEKLKNENKIEKIGFSLYYPHELEYLLSNGFEMDIIQIPYNVLDQRFQRYLPQLKDMDMEVHVRSVFLQGLLFKKPEELQGSFAKIKNKAHILRSLSAEMDVPLSAIYMNFVILNEFVDNVIIGVDGLKNLNENISAIKYSNKVENILDDLVKLEENDEDIILPINW
ncbi:MAG TPA: aldo/keto reductase [Methanobacteriaceae archaeon]|nr:aldo/keto reductase [Methanobacteriaceae archaeon]